MDQIQLAEQTTSPALLTLSSAVQSEREQLRTMFTDEQIANFSLNNSCDFEMIVQRTGADIRKKELEQALLMPFREVEAMVKTGAADFGGWTELDFLSELNDQLDYLQAESFTLYEAEVILEIAKQMYIHCPLSIAGNMKKHALICSQFLIIANKTAEMEAPCSTAA